MGCIEDKSSDLAKSDFHAAGGVTDPHTPPISNRAPLSKVLGRSSATAGSWRG